MFHWTKYRWNINDYFSMSVKYNRLYFNDDFTLPSLASTLSHSRPSLSLSFPFSSSPPSPSSILKNCQNNRSLLNSYVGIDLHTFTFPNGRSSGIYITSGWRVVMEFLVSLWIAIQFPEMCAVLCCVCCAVLYELCCVWAVLCETRV